MPQVRKSCSCGISAAFFQCCIMIETQVSMTASNFSGCFSRNYFLEGGFTFQWGRGEGFVFQMGGDFIFKWGDAPWRGFGFHRGFSKKIIGWGGGTLPPPYSFIPLWETLLPTVLKSLIVCPCIFVML